MFAGTLNTYGALEVRVTRLSTETTIAKIVQLVEEAEGSRAKSHAFVDRFAAVYTPIVIALAALIVVVPPLLFSAPWQAWIYRGFSTARRCVSVCTLVIATPVSIVDAISNAARRGVLVKGGVYLEELARLNVIAFDKTGTLTKAAGGDRCRALGDWSEDDVLRAAVSLEALSEHPLASAIIRAGKEQPGYRTACRRCV